MSGSTQPLEGMMVRIPIEVPVYIRKEIHRSLSAAGGNSMRNESRFTEYMMPDEWTPDNVKMGFKGEIKQHHTREQYYTLLAGREVNMSSYGRITIDLGPLIDVEIDGIKSSDDGLVQTIELNVPVHFHHEQNHIIPASGIMRRDNIYFVEFLFYNSYQQLMPKNLNGVLPSYAKLFLERDEFFELLKRRREKKDAYGRIVIELDPLSRQA